MGGTFGHDGYIYQSVVVTNLLLEYLLGKEGVSSFMIEVEEEDGFSVDCVIISRNFQKVHIFEVKGGHFSIKKTLESLEKCKTNLKEKVLINDKAECINYIIYKNDNQLTKKGRKKYASLLLQRPNEILEKSVFYGLGSLEQDSLDKCRDLIRRLIPNFDSERQKRLIYLFIRITIDHIIQHKAEDNRKGYGLSKDNIIQLKDFLSGWPDSFCEVLSEYYTDRFKDGSAVYTSLINALVLEENLQKNARVAIEEA